MDGLLLRIVPKQAPELFRREWRPLLVPKLEELLVVQRRADGRPRIVEQRAEGHRLQRARGAVRVAPGGVRDPARQMLGVGMLLLLHEEGGLVKVARRVLKVGPHLLEALPLQQLVQPLRHRVLRRRLRRGPLGSGLRHGSGAKLALHHHIGKLGATRPALLRGQLVHRPRFEATETMRTDEWPFAASRAAATREITPRSHSRTSGVDRSKRSLTSAAKSWRKRKSNPSVPGSPAGSDTAPAGRDSQWCDRVRRSNSVAAPLEARAAASAAETSSHASALAALAASSSAMGGVRRGVGASGESGNAREMGRVARTGVLGGGGGGKGGHCVAARRHARNDALPSISCEEGKGASRGMDDARERG